MAAACLHKALDVLLSSLVLQLKLPCYCALLRRLHPPLPEAVFDIQQVKSRRSCIVHCLLLLLICLFPQLQPFTLCALSQTMPGLKDAVASEEVVKGDSNVLKVGLPCLLLSLPHSTTCGCDSAPRLQFMCNSHCGCMHVT